MPPSSVSKAFDIAPLAPRHTTAAWVCLAGGLLFAGACMVPLGVSWKALHSAREAAGQARVALQRKSAVERAMAAEMASPAAMQRAKAWAQQMGLARISWSGLFEALEIAASEVKGGVSILSLTPTKLQPAEAELAITALAADASIMLTYIETLRKIHPAQRVNLTIQQPEEKVGPNVVRFQLSVAWDPTALSAVTFQSHAALAKATSESQASQLPVPVALPSQTPGR